MERRSWALAAWPSERRPLAQQLRRSLYANQRRPRRPGRHRRGVYGVPETFVVGADARIAFKHIGPLSDEAPGRTIIPLISRLTEKAGAEGS
jgi:hypothetical protein